MSQKNSNVFNVLPETYVLPKEYVNFIEAYSNHDSADNDTNYWIIKPCALSRGRGISVINDIA